MSAEALGELQGQVRAAGAASVARFARALGLDQLPAPWAVRSVGWSGDHVDVSVGPAADRGVVLQIAARVPGAQGLVETEHLVVRARGSGVPAPLERLLRRVAPARLAGATLEKLAAALLADPELRAPADEAARALFDGVRPAGRPETCLDGLLRPLGPSGLAELEALLGLAQSPWRVHAAAWNVDRLEIEAGARPEGRGIRLLLEPAGPGLRLAHDATPPPAELLERMGGRAGALARTDAALLAQRLAAAEDFGVPGLPVPAGLPQTPAPTAADAELLGLLQGAQAEAGPEERERFAALLALGRVAGLPPLRALAWAGDHVRFTLGDGAQEAHFALRARGERLALEADPPGAHAAWAARLAPRVAGLSLAAVAGPLGLHRPAPKEEEGAAGAPAPGPDGGEPAARTDVDDFAMRSRFGLYFSWHRTDHSLHFFFQETRCLLDALKPGRGDALVSHATRECATSHADPPLADVAYFRTRRRDPLLLGSQVEGALNLESYIGGSDVAAGRTQELLENMVLQAARAAGDQAVAVRIGCLPLVAGDSLSRAIRRARASGARFYVQRSLEPDKPERAVGGMLPRDRLGRLAPPERPRDAGAVALVGVERRAEQEEFTALAAALGLRPAGVVVPDGSVAAFERVAGAGLFAWVDRRGLAAGRTLGLEGLPVRELQPDTPVGLAATRAWVEALGRAAGAAEERIAAALAAAAPSAQTLAELRARAGRFALVFVTGPAEADLLLESDGSRGMGFRPLDVLHEMGFRTRLLFAGAEAARRRVAAALEGRPGERPELRPIGGAEQLAALLAEPDAGAVYSSFTYDPRIAAAGRCSFSEADFELGFGGFLRTARRLLGLCERRPLQGLERHLGRSA